MAIKGKGKTKGRQPARAPRRAPVEVKPPLSQRRWVQVSIAFVAGILAMMLVIWITNGLRQQRADDEAATEASAATRGRAAVEEPGGRRARRGRHDVAGRAAGRCSPTSRTTIAALQDGDVPDGAEASCNEAQDDAASAAEPLEAFALSDEVRDIGMDEGQVSWFLNSQVRYRAGARAVRAGGRHRGARRGRRGRSARGDRRLGGRHRGAAPRRRSRTGWTDYQNALASARSSTRRSRA